MRFRAIALGAFVIAAVMPVSVFAQDRATPERVDAAIRKAIAFLYKQQKGDNWEIVPQPDPKGDHADVKNWQWGGVTSVATCALLYAGESPQKPELRKAIEWLKQRPLLGYYALGFRCQVWAMIPATPDIKQIAMRDRNYLLAGVYKGGENMGFYPYYIDPMSGKGKPDNWTDHSVSQYGVLGMWAISQLNIEVPLEYWQMVEMGWKAHQHPSGGWGYRLRDNNKDWEKDSLAMTAAGLASLFITQEMIHPLDGLKCTGNYRDVHIERALDWIHKNFANFKEGRPFYALYGVERIGVASGYKYFGNLNWYQTGAEYLLSKQNPDGSWGNSDDHWNPHKVADTAFGLMFLSRGRAAVMMNKLDYTVERNRNNNDRPQTWNERARDVANIAKWAGRQFEGFLNWQIVNLRAPVEELHDAPILWISGKDTLSFTDEEANKLKAFVEQGGVIVGNADCASRSFADSFRKLGTKMFPTYEFRELPLDHPIYTNEQYKRTSWRSAPFLQGLSNGARELMLLFPTADPAASWQTQSFAGSREPLAQAMANIYLYAVEKKTLRFKGQTHIVVADPSKKTKDTIKVARLEYSGNWDPEPGGWRRLSAVMHNQNAVDLKVETVKLGAGKLSGYAAAHLTGTAKFKLSAAERAEIKKFVEGGGTLIVDAAGGSADFCTSAEAELAAIFPSAKLQTLKASDPSIAAVKRFEYRSFTKGVAGQRGPRLRSADVNGKMRIFFSGEDLSVGLVGQPVDGIQGYEPGTATAIMANLLLQAKK